MVQVTLAAQEEEGSADPNTREAEIKSKIHFIKAALKNLKSNFPQFKSVGLIPHITLFIDKHRQTKKLAIARESSWRAGALHRQAPIPATSGHPH